MITIIELGGSREVPTEKEDRVELCM